jgi:sugar O-acyltransferase (sialic acid O-acetyltransferase NeuD family)
MRKKVIIVGGGGLGRIVYDILSQNQDFCQQREITGFLDTRVGLVLPKEIPVPVLGNPLDYSLQKDELFIAAIGMPNWRRKLVAPLLAQGADFISYSNSSSIGARTSIGNGSFITPGAVISVDCNIGAFAYLDTYVILGHDVAIGDHCMVGAMSFLAGGVRVGNGVSIHPRATIAKGVSIGDNATIGIGSVVVKDVPAGVTVFGNPARVIYTNLSDDTP